jgi:hypothetical protein
MKFFLQPLEAFAASTRESSLPLALTFVTHRLTLDKIVDAYDDFSNQRDSSLNNRHHSVIA